MSKSEQPDFGQLGEVAGELMARLKVPGVAVGLYYKGEEQSAGFGVTNIENPLPVDSSTLFQIGSISKTITATVAMRLVEMGKLDLEAPIQRYLPDLRMSGEGVAAQITLRHLFTHTGGWLGDYFDDTGDGDDALAEYVARMADLPQWTPPGAVWSYNNAGFSLAGRVIEVVTGQPCETVIKELVFDPLSMNHTYFFARDVITYRFAVGHIIRDEKPEVAREWALARAANPVGGVVSCVRDMLRYARFQLGDGRAEDGTRLLSTETMRLMQSVLAEAGSTAEAVGVSWLFKTVGGQRIVMHGGATNGQMATLQMVPERDFALVVLTNAGTGSELHSDLSKWALQHYLDLTDPPLTPLELSEAELASYAGRYNAALSELDLNVDKGYLWVQARPKGGFPKKDSLPGPTPPPVRVVFYAPDKIIGLDAPFKDAKGEFLRHPDGSIAWLRISGRISARQE